MEIYDKNAVILTTKFVSGVIAANIKVKYKGVGSRYYTVKGNTHSVKTHVRYVKQYALENDIKYTNIHTYPFSDGFAHILT